MSRAAAQTSLTSDAMDQATTCSKSYKQKRLRQMGLVVDECTVSGTFYVLLHNTQLHVPHGGGPHLATIPKTTQVSASASTIRNPNTPLSFAHRRLYITHPSKSKPRQIKELAFPFSRRLHPIPLGRAALGLRSTQVRPLPCTVCVVFPPLQ
jgi:hypothetical protein